MIARLRGTIVSRTATDVVLETGGVGYQVSIPLSTAEALEGVKGEAILFTHLHVREDAFLLYGFATETEREAFRILLSVNGVGPKVALGVLSGIRVPELRAAVARGDAGLLATLPGVGRKTAERLIMELRGRLGDAADRGSALPATSAQARARSEAIVALMALGHSRPGAEKAVRAAAAEVPGADLPVEELVRRALAHA